MQRRQSFVGDPQKIPVQVRSGGNLRGWGRQEEKVVALEPSLLMLDENATISIGYLRQVYGVATGAIVGAHRRQIEAATS